MPINVGDMVGNPGEDLIYSMLANKKQEDRAKAQGAKGKPTTNTRKGVTEAERFVSSANASKSRSSIHMFHCFFFIPDAKWSEWAL